MELRTVVKVTLILMLVVCIHPMTTVVQAQTPTTDDLKPATGFFKVAIPGRAEIITEGGTEIREFSEGEPVTFTIAGQYPDGSWLATGPEGEVRIKGTDGCNCWTEAVEFVDADTGVSVVTEPVALDVTKVAPQGTFANEKGGVHVAATSLQYRGMGGNRKLLMGVRVKNNSLGQIHVNPWHCTIVALDGATFNHDLDTYSFGNYLDAVDVQPGAYAEGALVFPMPEGKGPRKLVYSDLFHTITIDFGQPLPGSIEPMPEATQAKMYEPVKVGNWELYVYKVHRQKQLWASEGDPTTADGIYALVRMKVTNQSGAPADLGGQLEFVARDDKMRTLSYRDVDWLERYAAHRVVSNHADTQDEILPDAPEWPVLISFDVGEDSQELWLDVSTRDGNEKASIYVSPCQSDSERICEGRFIDVTPKD